MRIYQHLPTEPILAKYIQEKEYEKAIEEIDWYYSRKNPEGFDRPERITKAANIEVEKKITIDIEKRIEIKTWKAQWIIYMIVLSGIYMLIYNVADTFENLFAVRLFAGIVIAVLIGVCVYQLIAKKSQITLTRETLTFKKSSNAPIRWDNVLAIYLYYGQGRYPFHSIIIWKKDSVKPEWFIISYLNRSVEEIVYVINEFKDRVTNSPPSPNRHR